jgi:hypothetical protein
MWPTERAIASRFLKLSMFQLDHARSLKVGVHAADNSIGSTIDGSSFSGLLTRFEIGHIRIGSAGNRRIRSRGSGFSYKT